MPTVKAKYDFCGRVAVVTGGCNGIGAQIAHDLRESGAKVSVWDLQSDLNDPLACQVDVTDRLSVERALELTIARAGTIDMLVNSAGYAGPTVPVDQYDPASWDRIIDVNLTGLFNVCRVVAGHMRKVGTGHIVNIASLAGKEGTPNASAYSAAKAGVLAFTKAIGKEFAATSIRINAIAPAAVRTALLDQMSSEHVQNMIDKSPMKRLGEPEEVSAMTAWLCSDSCTFNSGAVFDLSGGRATY